MNTAEQSYRLPVGGLIDRRRSISFTFDGRPMTGFAGDTAASALLAAGVRIVGRSFKAHRPRGVFAAGVEEPNAVISVLQETSFEPMMRATQVVLREGMAFRSLNAWPSAKHDAAAIFGLAAPLMVSGFYYKTFLWPSWKFYEGFIRRAAGIGRLRPAPDRIHYEHVHESTDILVIGGGPAGLVAAQGLVESGLSVTLAEDQPQLGGSLLWDSARIDGIASADWAAACERRLRRAGNIRVLSSSTVCGAYEGNLFVISERAINARGVPVHRIRKLQAKHVILAPGAVERPIPFQNNDRPGVMLASALRRYVNQYAVAPGRRAVIFTNNDSAYWAACDLVERGINVAALIDCRPAAGVAARRAVESRGIAARFDSQILDVRGRRGVTGVTVGNNESRARESLACDLLGVSGGWTPLVHLASHRGPRPVYDPGLAAFVMRELPSGWVQAGSVAATGSIAEAMSQGAAAARALIQVNARSAVISAEMPAVDEPANVAPGPFWREVAGDPGRMWIDFQSDVTARDVALAARENYASVEHLKRYTTTGMAIDQGRTSNVNALSILARETNRDVGEVGVTTFRPPFVGLKMNAVAGIGRGPLHAPMRRTPLHDEHLGLSADMVDFGPWRRPDHYGKNGPDRERSVAVEMAAVREGVGLFDASPLGKIEVAGLDAAVFLDRFYISNLLTLKPGDIRYSLMLREDGVVFDDGVIACLSPTHFLASPTSAHADQVAALFERWRQTEWPKLRVAVASVSSNWATLAIAGPRARDLLSRLQPSMPIDPQSFRHMNFRPGSILGVSCRIARVSFTGELQFEISVRSRFAAALWRHLLNAGEDLGIRAVGMEAWLRLRLEKGFIHIGTDTDGRSTPDDIGFGAIAARKTADFLGKRSLSLSYMAGSDRERLVGLRTAKGVKLEVGGRIFAPGHTKPPAPTDGRVTSACFSPSAGGWIGLALLTNGRGSIGSKVTIYQMGRQIQATVVAPPFYDPSGIRMQA